MEVLKLVYHCSDSNVPAHDDISVIREWHLARHFVDVGYHYFIKRDGTVQPGRPETQSGAHTRNHNSTSLGICLSGKDQFTEAQFLSLAKLSKYLLAKYGLTKECVYGHNQLCDYKTCPNFNVDLFKRKYL